MKIIYLTLGSIFLCLGLVGVALPIIPTTPFLILTAFLYSKGSTRFHQWFLETKLYKNHLEDFIKTKSMPLKKKIIVLFLASIMLLIAFLLVDSLHAKIAIVLVCIFKYYYFIFKIKNS